MLPQRMLTGTGCAPSPRTGFNSRFGRRNRPSTLTTANMVMMGMVRVEWEDLARSAWSVRERLDWAKVTSRPRNPSDTQPAILRMNIRKTAPGSVRRLALIDLLRCQNGRRFLPSSHPHRTLLRWCFSCNRQSTTLRSPGHAPSRFERVQPYCRRFLYKSPTHRLRSLPAALK